jgi:hypothetical protein
MYILRTIYFLVYTILYNYIVFCCFVVCGCLFWYIMKIKTNQPHLNMLKYFYLYYLFLLKYSTVHLIYLYIHICRNLILKTYDF